MEAATQHLLDLENKFWQSMVDEDTDTALSLLDEPALMVSTHGSMKFDHAGYRKMAEQGTMVVRSYELGDVDVVFPADDVGVLIYRVRQTLSPRGKPGEVRQEMIDSSTWVRKDGRWLCAMHTETPVEPAAG